MARRLREELQQTKPFESPEEEAWLEIQRTACVTARWVAEALKPTGLSPSQFNVLRILRGARPAALPSARIAERMVDHDPDLTRLLDRLATAGLVTKERDEADRRVINVAITKAGLRVVEAATAAAQARIRDEFKSIPKSKLETLSDLLELVRGSAR
jgi:DNA-binding MarR family transcriptional regulator